jgi:hypothetical protein
MFGVGVERVLDYYKMFCCAHQKKTTIFPLVFNTLEPLSMLISNNIVRSYDCSRRHRRRRRRRARGEEVTFVFFFLFVVFLFVARMVFLRHTALSIHFIALFILRFELF